MTTERDDPGSTTKIAWKDPWFEISDPEHRAGIEKELSLEIGPLHPLWRTELKVIGRRDDCDDVATELADGRFAIVHPVWHGHIDQFPEKFPFTSVLATVQELQAQIDSDAEEWSDQD